MRSERVAGTGVERPARRRTVFVTASLGVATLLGAACSGGAGENALDRPRAGDVPRAASRPHIVWIVADAVDEAIFAGAAGFERLDTVRTTTIAAVTSDPASVRTALLTGVSPATLGIDAATGRLAAPPPAGVTVLPEQLRRAGYYTSRAGPPRHNLRNPPPRHASPVRIVHVDGGVHDAARALPVAAADLAQSGLLGAWDAAGPDADWRGREKDWESPCTVSFGCGGARSPGPRPFFALFNLAARDDVGAQVERIAAALADDDLLEETVVFLVGASGSAPAAGVRWPASIAEARESDAPVSLLDLAPTAVALAGLPVPAHMEGRALVVTEENWPPVGPAAAVPAKGTPSAAGVNASGPTPAEAPVAATPEGYPTGGLFHVAPRVDLRCATEGSTIVYTTEHEAPFYWRLYTGPFRMRFWTLRFQCGRLGYRDSDIVTFDFDIE
ncbi:MAG: hypothetical protein OXQ28_12550 [Acidobacteriota bacterium]|nr:hypothetical protein [Acidobacteriota bacterium]